MIYNIPLTIILGMYQEGIATSVLLLFLMTIFYLSRYKQQHTFSFTLFAGCCISFFAYTYFTNGGIDGSSLLSLSIAYFMILLVAPRKQYLIWTLFFIMLIGGLLYTEYYYPEFVSQNYASRGSRFIDIGSTFLMTMIFFICCLSFVINNYNQEKQTVEDKSLILKRLNDQKNKLISVISHDFNSPLNNIKRYLHLLQQMELDSEERKMLEKELMQVTNDTQNLLLNLLNWTKNNMDSMRYTPEIVNIKDALADTIPLYRNIAEEKLIKFDYNISPNINVEGNYEMIDIVMRNLISNAVKFTEEGGYITITAKEEGLFCRLMVINSGAGVPLNQQSTLFTTQTSPSYGTRNEKGIGLGLSLCKEFTETMDGQIGFTSEPGIKAEFFVQLRAVNIENEHLGMTTPEHFLSN